MHELFLSVSPVSELERVSLRPRHHLAIRFRQRLLALERVATATPLRFQRPHARTQARTAKGSAGPWRTRTSAAGLATRSRVFLPTTPHAPLRPNSPHTQVRPTLVSSWSQRRSGVGQRAGCRSQRPHPSPPGPQRGATPVPAEDRASGETGGQLRGSAFTAAGSRQARSRRHTLQCTAAGSRQARS